MRLVLDPLRFPAVAAPGLVERAPEPARAPDPERAVDPEREAEPGRAVEPERRVPVDSALREPTPSLRDELEDAAGRPPDPV